MKRWMIILIASVVLLGLSWLVPHSLFSVGVETPTLTPASTIIATSTIQAEPTGTQITQLTSLPTKAGLSFTAAIYKDETNAFEVDYPADWTLVPNNQIGSRASTAQLFSPGSTAEKLLDGGTRMAITVYQWDPKGDLAAYAAHRKSAWDSGGSNVISETSGELAGGRKQMSFTVQGPDKLQSFFLVTTVGENYLEIAGDGNLAVIEEIARTMRPLNFKQ